MRCFVSVSMNEEALVFNGSGSNTPCFYKADISPPPVFDPSAVPDGYVLSPVDFPQNDVQTLAKTQILTSQLRPGSMPIAPGTCTVNPRGFVCGPLPAPNGTLVKCVPRMDHSDLNQLSARVLPLTVSRANGSLDDPARPDPRFSLFPKQYPAAYSRCCNGVIGDPLDVKPMTCEAQVSKPVFDRVIPEYHKVKAMELGFRTRPNQIEQLKFTAKEETAQGSKFANFGNDREKIWRLESDNIKTLLSSLDPTLMGLLPNRKYELINFF